MGKEEEKERTEKEKERKEKEKERKEKEKEADDGATLGSPSHVARHRDGHLGRRCLRGRTGS